MSPSKNITILIAFEKYLCSVKFLNAVPDQSFVRTEVLFYQPNPQLGTAPISRPLPFFNARAKPCDASLIGGRNDRRPECVRNWSDALSQDPGNRGVAGGRRSHRPATAHWPGT